MRRAAWGKPAAGTMRQTIYNIYYLALSHSRALLFTFSVLLTPGISHGSDSPPVQ